MSGPLITLNMLNNIDYDIPDKDVSKSDPPICLRDDTYSPTVLVVFCKSDINSALYHLTKSMEAPYKNDAIATVLIEESIKESFTKKLESLLKPLNSSTKELFKHFKATFPVKAEYIETDGIPRVVYNLNHEHFDNHSGIVTMHIFRTTKECISLIQKESLSFANVSIWHENHAFAYDLVVALKSRNFYINCHNVELTTIQSKCLSSKTFAIIRNGYHYERLFLEDIEKNVVFPIGSIFAN